MDHKLKNILLILVGVTLVGGLTGLFNTLYGTIIVSVLVAYIAITVFWKDLLIILQNLFPVLSSRRDGDINTARPHLGYSHSWEN